MKLINAKLLSFFFSLFFVNTVSANLIVNGGFENNELRFNTWSWFDSSKVDGWEGSNIEIWHNYAKFDSFEGSQHAELNAHPSSGEAFSIFQAFNTEIGRVYDFEFAYSARRNTDESFQVDVVSDQTNIYSRLITDHTVKSWSVFDDDFTAIAAQTVLMFTSVTPYSGTVGNFLDDIKVTARPVLAKTTIQVAEPYSPLLFGLVLVGWFISRRIKSTK